MLDSLHRRDPGLGAPLGAAPAGPVRITPNRRQIDRRFPVLGFTVDAGGLPWFEVLLTTDRSLFDPANAGRRSASNFYASRQDSGLIAAELQGSVYMAPTAVLHAFAGAAEIYYTAIAYQGKDGSGPAFAQAPAELPVSAPSVSVSADLRQAASGLSASILSVPLSKLSRLRDDGSLSAPYEVPQTFAAAPEEDRGEGEDGYGLAAADGGWGPQSLAGREGWDYDDGFQGPAGEPGQEEEQEPYADEAGALWAGAQESTFPAGARTPAQLEDEDDHVYGDPPADPQPYGEDESYDDGFGAEGAEGESYAAAADPGEYRGEGDEPPPPFETLEAVEAFQTQPLTIPEKRRILDQITPFESGRDLYAAINADGEFEGRFPNHPAHGRYHVGLSFGNIQFTQDSGNLGRLLSMMRQRDAAEFRRIFGASSDELVRVTTAAGPVSSASPGGRSARVQPVEGADLWREPWLARFRQAAAQVPFQAAQNELAATLYVDPMLPFAAWLELNTDRALAIVVDRAIQMGVGGARRWISEAVGPVQTPAQRQQALAALGHSDLAAFQRATTGLGHDGQWGPETHAAMVAALRRIGSRSPVPIPTRDQMMDALVRRAAGTPWERRVTQLRGSTAFNDVVYTL